MARRRIASFIVPLVGQPFKIPSLSNNQQLELNRKYEHLAVTKPTRRLGAGWISDFVERRKNFTLCETCARKYDINWWKRYEYISDWVGWLTNCDGCREWTRSNMYYPREVISQVLHPRFWKK